MNALETGLHIYYKTKVIYCMCEVASYKPNLGIPGSDDKLWLLVAWTLECGIFKTFALAEVE